MRQNNLNNKSMFKLVNEVIVQKKNYSMLRLCNAVVYLKYANERMGYSEGSKKLTIKKYCHNNKHNNFNINYKTCRSTSLMFLRAFESLTKIFFEVLKNFLSHE